MPFRVAQIRSILLAELEAEPVARCRRWAVLDREVGASPVMILLTHKLLQLPQTGRKALYVNRTFTLRFKEMTEAESAPLLGGTITVLAGVRYRVWAVNQRGYGRTTRPTQVGDYALPHLVDDVTALINAASAKNDVLIGHDWGAMVAWCFAAEQLHPWSSW